MSAEDHIAIQQLLHQYCHAVDRGTADDVAALFHETAVLVPRYESDQRHQGREAIRAWYGAYMKNFRAKVRYLRHKIESPVIEIAGDDRHLDVLPRRRLHHHLEKRAQRRLWSLRRRFYQRRGPVVVQGADDYCLLLVSLVGL